MSVWLRENICQEVAEYYQSSEHGARKVSYECRYGSNGYNRNIRIGTSLQIEDWEYLCFVTFGHEYRVYLELDGEFRKKHRKLHHILQQVCNQNGLTWEDENGAYWLGKDFDVDERGITACLIEAFDQLIDLLDNIVCSTLQKEQVTRESFNDLYSRIEHKPLNGQVNDNPVRLETLRLAEVMNLDLSIPSYQRIYCWPQKNVELLLDDLFEKRDHEYHLGTIILQMKEGRYDIIDGQQRLVTLALILRALGVDDVNLLNESFESVEAKKYVGYNRYLIESFIGRHHFDNENLAEWRKQILQFISFDVLILQDSSLDLAYTFFSTQNSRGKALTDYELLKSHHLRYIPDNYEQQQRHLATRWDSLLVSSERESGDKSVNITLGIFLYCVRKWTRNSFWYIKEEKRVKNEFEAAPTIPDIPAFGEKFDFMDPIQGGAHFFAFVEHFIQLYHQYVMTPQFRIIWETISCSGVIEQMVVGKNGVSEAHFIENKKQTHWWYGDIISTFLFAYYVKFGTQYLPEALTCITRIVSQLRYATSKVNKQSLMEKACGTGIIHMINQATSPTFFLAEARAIIKRLPFFNRDDDNMAGIRTDFFNREVELYSKNKKFYTVDFSNLHNND